MSLISYIISSILLSWAGIGAYLALRWLRPSFASRRLILWLILSVSFLLPLSAPFQQEAHPEGHLISHDAVAKTVISPVPVGSESLQDFCSCSAPHAGDVIMYQASRVYDFLITHSAILLTILLVVGIFALLRFIGQTAFTFRMIRRHAAEWVEVQGRRVRMVRGIKRLTAGSMRLGRRYIFWSEALDALPEADQQAIMLHEYSHIRQGNTVEKLSLSLIQTLWWMNPAFYFISRELELLSEYVADAYAASQVPSRKRYAELLLQIKSSQAFAPVQFFRGSSLKRRVEVILKPQSATRIHFIPALGLWLLLMFPGEIVAQSIIQEQLRDIEVYEFLTEKNQQTGQEEFCKKCTMDAVQNCY